MATNLIGLVNQLQQMENTFTSVLLEAALKLTALTETNVFVVVESGESRRFGGAPHLCESYVASSLRPTGNDIRVSLRDFHPTLIETPLLPVPPTSAAFDPNMYFSPVSPSTENRHGSTRRLQSSANFNVSGHRPIAQSAPNSPSLTPQSRKRMLLPENPVSSPPKIPKSESVGMKVEISTDEKIDCGDAAVGRNEAKVKDSSLPISFDVEDVVNLASPSFSNDDDSDIILDDEVVPDDPSSSGISTPSVENSVGQCRSLGQDMQWVHDFVTSNPKALALLEIADESIADRNHPIGKIFSSFLYAFGIQVACSWRAIDTLDWRAYFSKCFEAMWVLFPKWHALDQSGIVCGRGKSEKLSVRSFCRVTAQVACRNKLRRLNLLN